MEEQHEDAGSAGIPRPAQDVIAPIESVFRPYEYRSGTTVKVVGVCCRSCRLDWKFITGAPQHQVCPRCANICNLIYADDTFSRIRRGERTAYDHHASCSGTDFPEARELRVYPYARGGEVHT